jgi:Flp pilus assembly protein TadG
MMRTFGGRRSGSSDRRNDEGATAVTVAVLIVVLIGLAALVVDLGSLYTERAKLSTAADAAALAAAQKLPDVATARADAKSYAASNAPEGTVVSIGFYDGDVFYSAAASLPDSDATVRAAVWLSGSPGGVVETCYTPPVSELHVPDTVHITVTNPNAPLYFARIWNLSSTSVSASSIARVETPALKGVMPIGVSAGDVSATDFGFAVGQVVNLANGNAPGHYGWMTLNDPPVSDPGNNDKWQKDEFIDVVDGGGTSFPVYETQYPGVTGEKTSYMGALQYWYSNHASQALVTPVIDSWGNGSKAVTVIGFARWSLTQSPSKNLIVAKYLGAVAESDMELSAFWPDSGLQHYSLIR